MTDVLGPATLNAVTARPARSITRGATPTWFQDCSAPGATDGTVFGSDFFNDVLAQLRTAFTDSAITQDNADDMLWRAMQSIGIRGADDTGTANTLVATFSPALAAPYPYVMVAVKVKFNNTGATTLNGTAVVRRDGTPLQTGDLVAGQVPIFVFINSVWQLVTGQAASATVSGPAHGQCNMSLQSGILVLAPVNGNALIINGTVCAVPAAGVSLAPTGLTPATLYYIYAYMVGSTMTLEAVTTGHSTNSSGVEIKTGDGTRTLVGMVYVVTGPAFSDVDGARYVLSWFNRGRKSSKMWFTVLHSTSSGTLIEINSEIRSNFLVWGNTEVAANITGKSVSVGLTAGVTAISFDGGTVEHGASEWESNFAGGNYAMTAAVYARKSGLSEGKHYATLFGMVDAGTCQWCGLTETTGPSVAVTLTVDFPG